VNIALAALGGRVVNPADVADKHWRVSNLLDGFPIIRGASVVETSLGWRATAPTFPQELVVAFHGNREATVAAVVIDTTADGSTDNTSVIPKDVEVWASTAATPDGFTRVAAATLEPAAKEQVLRFAPVHARYIKLVVFGTHGNRPAEIGELQIYEPANVPSIAADVPRNLVLPALGGSIVDFTSQLRDGVATELVDDRVSDAIGWCSAIGPLGAASHLPQEFTFAFRDHRSAFIDRIVIDPTSGMRYFGGVRPNKKTWIKTVELLASTTNAWDGFESLGVLSVPAEAKPVTLPVRRAMRYVKLRILENNGAEQTTLGEVQVIEGASAGERSILMGRSASATSAGGRTAGSEVAARREREPNDTVAQADPMQPGVAVGGRLSPAGDQDFFSLPASTSAGRQALTLDLEGVPAIRTHINVVDRSGRLRQGWDPAQVSGTRARFSLLVDPGDVWLRVTQPPGAEVVIWDRSGSMAKSAKDLEAGLRQYIDRVEPGDQVNLVRFDASVDVLLKAFTSDRAALAAALKGKMIAGGGTAIYDAVGKGIELLRPVSGNRSIILMTDGEDTSSRTDPPTFWRTLAVEHVRLYVIGFGAGLRSFVARSGATADRVLSNAATSTGGRFLIASTSGELAAFYRQLAEELHAPATYALSTRMSGAVGALSVTAVGGKLASVAAPQQIELVLDASGSMKRRIGAKSMMDIARQVLSKAVSGLPDDAQVALRVYGHRVPEGRPEACHDTQLVVPFGKLNRPRLLAQINAVKALGTTPIAYAIQAAAADFSKKPGQKMLIIVTDGQEECGGDPEAAAATLRAQGADVTLNIVGFGLTTAKEREVMSKVAGAAGGRYFAAKDGTALDSALEQALAVGYEVVDGAGEVAARGIVGSDAVQLPEGVYTVLVRSAGAPIAAEHVQIVANQSTAVELQKEGSEVHVRVVASGSSTNKPR
jgi:Mg-chelatase subunit ChlD